MGRKKSKKNYMPIGFCGSFFPIDFLKELKDIVLEEESSKISIEDFMNVFIGGFEFKDFPYMKENCFLLINEKHIYDYEEKYIYCAFRNISFHSNVFSAHDGSGGEHGIPSSS